MGMSFSSRIASRDALILNVIFTIFHKLITIYMEGLILGINTLYRAFCFLV